MPRFTIGIPTYNRANFLPRAIECALAQTWPNVEVIVSDNASTDETPEIVRSYGDRVRYHRNETNIGLNENFTLLPDLASGDYFAWLQDDDQIHPELLSRAAAGFDRHRDAVLYSAYLATSDRPFHDKNGWLYLDTIIGPEVPVALDQDGPKCWPGILVAIQCLIQTPVQIPAAVFQVSHLRAHLPFDQSMGLGTDRELTGRLCTHGPVLIDPRVGGIYQFHAGQETKRYSGKSDGAPKIAEKLIEYFESQSIDWRSLLSEWFGYLSPRRRLDYYHEVNLIEFPDALKETVRAMGLKDEDPRCRAIFKTNSSILPRLPSSVEAVKGLARASTPPALWSLMSGLKEWTQKIGKD